MKARGSFLFATIFFTSLSISGCMTGPIQATWWTHPSYPDGSQEEAVRFGIDQTECATEAINNVPEYRPQVQSQTRDSGSPGFYSAFRDGQRAALEDELAAREYRRAIQTDSLRTSYFRTCMMKRGWRAELRTINAR